MVLQDEILTYTPEQLKNYAGATIIHLFSTVIIAVGVFFFLYLVSAVALTRIAKKLNFKNPYIAWIPFASPYLEGRICDFMRSEKLDQSHTRIHYFMLSFMYIVSWGGYQLFNIKVAIDQCFEMYNTGVIPMSLMSGGSDSVKITVSVIIYLLGFAVAFFRLRALFMSHICFNKKKGILLIILTCFLPIITPFLYLSLSRMTPVNTNIEKMNINPLK